MSGKSAKKVRKEKESKLADYNTRKDSFLKDIRLLSEKYKIDLVATLEYGNTALLSTITLVDMKDKYEHITEEGKQKLETEGNHRIKLEV